MLAGPEIARMISEFGDIIEGRSAEYITSHHEDMVSFEKKFRKDVKSLYSAYIEDGNPFEEEDDVLTKLGDKVVMNEHAIKFVHEARKRGKDQYDIFKVERLVTATKSIHDVIKKNKLPLFRQKNTIATKKSQEKISSLKQDCNLYASLYVSCQARESDLDDFFSHENHSYPPALSVYGKIRHSAKSDTIKLFAQSGSEGKEEPIVSGVVLDGAAIVQMTPACQSKTFGEYSDNEFTNHLVSKTRCTSINRLDVVFDVYRKKSIKSFAREERGAGTRIRVTSSTPVTRDWRSFLRVNENKEELFRLLTSKCLNNEKLSTIQVNFAVDDEVYRLIVIIALALFSELNLEELWIEFGTGKDRRWLPIHKYATELGGQICSGLLFWYSFTGCDTTPSFRR